MRLRAASVGGLYCPPSTSFFNALLLLALHCLFPELSRLFPNGIIYFRFQLNFSIRRRTARSHITIKAGSSSPHNLQRDTERARRDGSEVLPWLWCSFAVCVKRSCTECHRISDQSNGSFHLQWTSQDLQFLKRQPFNSSLRFTLHELSPHFN